MSHQLGKEPTVVRSFRLPGEVDRRLRARALLDDVPDSEIVRRALVAYLARART